MADEKPLIPTWGYHSSEAPRIHTLRHGEALPDGWHDTPDQSKWKAVKPNVKPKPVEAGEA